jgi:hypothetical protein
MNLAKQMDKDSNKCTLEWLYQKANDSLLYNLLCCGYDPEDYLIILDKIENEDIAKEIREESDLELLKLLKQVACNFADKCQDEAPADTELYGATLSTACALIEKVCNTKD